MRTADLLAAVELLAFRKRNLAFQEYLTICFRGMTLEGRERELTKKCLRYRHRRSLGMNIEDRSTLRIPIINREYLAMAEVRGGCFPLPHFGYHYAAHSSLGDSVSVPFYSGLIMEKSKNLVKEMTNKVKSNSMTSHGGDIPVYGRDTFLHVVLPEVAAAGKYAISV